MRLYALLVAFAAAQPDAQFFSQPQATQYAAQQTYTAPQPTYYGANQQAYVSAAPAPQAAAKGIPIDIGRIVDSDLVYPGAFPNVAWSGNPNPALAYVTAWDGVAANLNTDGVLDQTQATSGVPVAVASQLNRMGMGPQPSSAYSVNRFAMNAPMSYGTSYPTSYPSSYASSYASSYPTLGANYGTNYGMNYGTSYPTQSYGYSQPNYGYSNYGYSQPNYGFTQSSYQPGYSNYGYSQSAPVANLNWAAAAPAQFPLMAQPEYVNYGAAAQSAFGAPIQGAQAYNYAGFGDGMTTMQRTQVAVNPTNLGAPVAQIPTAALAAAFPRTYGPQGGVYPQG